MLTSHAWSTYGVPANGVSLPRASLHSATTDPWGGSWWQKAWSLVGGSCSCPLPPFYCQRPQLGMTHGWALLLNCLWPNRSHRLFLPASASQRGSLRPATQGHTGQFHASSWDLHCTAVHFPELSKEADNDGSSQEHSLCKSPALKWQSPNPAQAGWREALRAKGDGATLQREQGWEVVMRQSQPWVPAALGPYGFLPSKSANPRRPSTAMWLHWPQWVSATCNKES